MSVATPHCCPSTKVIYTHLTMAWEGNAPLVGNVIEAFAHASRVSSRATDFPWLPFPYHRLVLQTVAWQEHLWMLAEAIQQHFATCWGCLAHIQGDDLTTSAMALALVDHARQVSEVGGDKATDSSMPVMMSALSLSRE